MGTVFSFDLRDASMDPHALDDAIGWLHWVDETFSTYQPGSVLSRLRRGQMGLDDCPPQVGDLLKVGEAVEHDSGGYFTTTLDGKLDLTGVVKGWAVERASEILRAGGSRAHTVNGGGDLQLVGEPRPGRPWRIGVAHPLRPGALATVVTVGGDHAVATSGTAERGNHIIDPRTGRPATELASVTLVGQRLTTVDAYATAAFAMGNAARDWVERLAGCDAFAVTRHGGCWWTSGFPQVGVVPAVSPIGVGHLAVDGDRKGVTAC